FTLIRSAYLKGLREYGVASVSDVAVSNAPGLPITLPTVAFDPTFPSSNDFDEPDVIEVITRLLDAGQLPRPDQIRGTPFYCVIPQQGSFYRPEEPPAGKQGSNGSHSTFGYRGTNCLYAWAFQGGNVDGTSPFVIHELVEAVSAKGAGF